ncbi:MAG: hypothetical protein KA733_00455 [Thauera sp.]|nr:hypothetical protein [Thauera sp.]MBP7639229.1 hypothetical protein [Thauera sp.]
MRTATDIDMTPYCGDDYDRIGCTAVIRVTKYGYALSILAPNGAPMEIYRSVKSSETIARMLREWCEGKVPRLPAADQSELKSCVTS